MKVSNNLHLSGYLIGCHFLFFLLPAFLDGLTYPKVREIEAFGDAV